MDLSCDVGSSGIIFEAFRDITFLNPFQKALFKKKTYHFFSIVERFGPIWTLVSLAQVSRVGYQWMNRMANMMNIKMDNMMNIRMANMMNIRHIFFGFFF